MSRPRQETDGYWADLRRKRIDIQFLRFIAVLVVVLFHLDEEWLPHGYLGVDMFFVISGFVIARGMFVRSHDGEVFRANDFLWRRVNRLLPAMLFTLSLTLIAGFLFFPAEMYASTAASAIYALCGISNVYFFTLTDYFSAPLETMPLLHTWSLSVEEQFYLLFAVVAGAIGVLGVKLSRWMMVIWTILSVLSLLLVLGGFDWVNRVSVFRDLGLDDAASSFAFFMLPGRVYQLGLGIIGAWMVVCWARIRLAPGTAGLLWWIFTISSCLIVLLFRHFPTEITGTIVLSLMVLGALVTGEGTFQDDRSRWMRIPAAVGDRSYSIYLVHWPVIVFLAFATAMPTVLYQSKPWVVTLTAIVLIAILSEISWRFFERRPSSETGRWQGFRPVGIVYGMLFIVAASFYIHAQAGMPGRAAGQDADLDTYFAYGEDESKLEWIPEYGSSSKHALFSRVSPKSGQIGPRVLVIGDSHANQLVPMGRYFAVTRGHEWDFFQFTGCPPLFGHYKKYGVDVQELNEKELEAKRQVEIWEEFLAENQGHYDFVVLASRWNWMFDHDFSGMGGPSRGWYRKDALVSADDPDPDLSVATSRSNFVPALNRTLEAIEAAGAEPIVMGQVPLSPKSLFFADPASLPVYMLSKELNNQDTQLYKRNMERGEFVDSILRGRDDHGLPPFHAVIPSDIFSDHEKQNCLSYVHYRPVMADSNHLSHWGVIHLAKTWEQADDFPFD
ncbi:acyltransferase [bacterium]|nr:acyltransferase [bacterium]